MQDIWVKASSEAPIRMGGAQGMGNRCSLRLFVFQSLTDLETWLQGVHD